jgi:precorrin-8X/cobalt-precorrin-8 methylmutase
VKTERIHPIEAQSYRILERHLDLSQLRPLERAVVARILHASADVELARTVVVDEGVLEAGVEALRRDAVIVTDVKMVASGLARPARCYLEEVVEETIPTRSSAAIKRAARAHPVDAIFVVGCAPTALFELVSAAAGGEFQPSLVVGLPVGFVGAAEAKEALRRSGLPSLSNVGPKGGSAVACAALNALIREADVR